GRVELLLVVQRAGALAELDAAVLADDLPDRRLVGLDAGAAALVADVAEAGLVQVPAALLEEAEQAVLDRLLRALGRLLRRQRERRLVAVGDAGDRRAGVGHRDRVHGLDR